MKRLMMIAVAVVVLALGVVAIGGAAAEEDDGIVGSFLGRVADKLGVSEDELQTAIDDARTETLDEAVAEGRLTEQQAERMRERGFPFAGGRMLHGRGHVMDAAAEVLDMTRADLIVQLQDGNSLADVAEAQGMSLDDFKAALLAEVQAQLDELVAEGDLTQDQADEIFQRTEDNINNIVTGEGCRGGFGGMRPGPGGFGGLSGLGFGPFSGNGADSAETSDVTA
jgi:lambda repressor-like predicted transcriptional regulator